MSDGRVALVTGAAAGIGLEIARQLSVTHTVLLSARTLEKADAAAAAIPNAIGLALDVSKANDAKRVAKLIASRFGHLDCLVNNAATGFDFSASASNVDLEQVAATYQTNLFGAWRLIQALRPFLARAPEGRIVNVSSGAGSHADTQFGLHANNASLPAYATSKSALNALTAIFAKELRKENIVVTAVCPGLTNSHPETFSIPGARSVEEGAAGIVWAATASTMGDTGGLFRDQEPLGW